jgi:hypothetical protein
VKIPPYADEAAFLKSLVDTRETMFKWQRMGMNNAAKLLAENFIVQWYGVGGLH